MLFLKLVSYKKIQNKIKNKYLLFAFLILTGCMVGPNYHEPETSMPTQFEQDRYEEGKTADLCQWWKQFNDLLLDRLIAEAIHANYDLRIALEKIEQARAQYRIEKSYLWPEIDFNASAIRSRFSQNLFPTPATPSGTTTSSSFFPTFLNVFQVGFDAIWELDLFGKFRRSRNAAYFTWESMIEDAQTVLISMLSEVAITYVNIRAVQKKIELIKQKIQAGEQELQITKGLFRIGIDNETQCTTLISSVESDRASLPSLETSFKQNIYALAYLLGRQAEGLLEEFQEIGSIPSSNDKVPIGLPSDLLRRRPDVRSAERQLAAATEQIGAAVADLFPRISLTGISFGTGQGASIGFEGDELNRLFKWPSRTFSVGVNLNWSLIDFGKVRGQIAVQNSLQKQALLNYEQTVIASLKDVESALVAYFEEQKRKDSLTLKVIADRRTLKITEDLYKIGLANALQVLEARKTLFDSENSLVESEQALTGDLIAIYKAIGGDWCTESSPLDDDEEQSVVLDTPD
jgi:outer membrane protein, multidrug efflux system